MPLVCSGFSTMLRQGHLLHTGLEKSHEKNIDKDESVC